jgi:hypothetical protein
LVVFYFAFHPFMQWAESRWVAPGMVRGQTGVGDTTTTARETVLDQRHDKSEETPLVVEVSDEEGVTGRAYTNVSPQEMKARFNGHTDIQGASLAAPYLGKWIRLCGKFKNVTLYGGERFSVDLGGLEQVGLWFAPRWKDRFEILQPGEHMTVEGQIRSAERHWVFIEHCEVV